MSSYKIIAMAFANSASNAQIVGNCTCTEIQAILFKQGYRGHERINDGCELAYQYVDKNHIQFRVAQSSQSAWVVKVFGIK